MTNQAEAAANLKLIDYSGIPHRHHVYTSSGRAKALVDLMLDKGCSEEDCGKFLGGKLCRVMGQVWK